MVGEVPQGPIYSDKCPHLWLTSSGGALRSGGGDIEGESLSWGQKKKPLKKLL